MTTLAERLRSRHPATVYQAGPEAADEIERLIGEVRMLARISNEQIDEIERLRLEIKMLSHELDLLVRAEQSRAALEQT